MLAVGLPTGANPRLSGCRVVVDGCFPCRDRHVTSIGSRDPSLDLYVKAHESPPQIEPSRCRPRVGLFRVGLNEIPSNLASLRRLARPTITLDRFAQTSHTQGGFPAVAPSHHERGRQELTLGISGWFNPKDLRVGQPNSQHAESRKRQDSLGGGPSLQKPTYGYRLRGISRERKFVRNSPLQNLIRSCDTPLSDREGSVRIRSCGAPIRADMPTHISLVMARSLHTSAHRHLLAKSRNNEFRRKAGNRPFRKTHNFPLATHLRPSK
jgi:hypothetical protein